MKTALILCINYRGVYLADSMKYMQYIGIYSNDWWIQLDDII